MRDTRAELYERLNQRLRYQAKNAGVPLDAYDPDFLLGVIMHWLDENDAVLTSTGVRRLKVSR